MTCANRIAKRGDAIDDDEKASSNKKTKEETKDSGRNEGIVIQDISILDAVTTSNEPKVKPKSEILASASAIKSDPLSSAVADAIDDFLVACQTEEKEEKTMAAAADGSGHDENNSSLKDEPVLLIDMEESVVGHAGAEMKSTSGDTTQKVTSLFLLDQDDSTAPCSEDNSSVGLNSSSSSASENGKKERDNGEAGNKDFADKKSSDESSDKEEEDSDDGSSSEVSQSSESSDSSDSSEKEEDDDGPTKEESLQTIEDLQNRLVALVEEKLEMCNVIEMLEHQQDQHQQQQRQRMIQERQQQSQRRPRWHGGVQRLLSAPRQPRHPGHRNMLKRFMDSVEGRRDVTQDTNPREQILIKRAQNRAASRCRSTECVPLMRMENELQKGMPGGDAVSFCRHVVALLSCCCCAASCMTNARVNWFLLVNDSSTTMGRPLCHELLNTKQ